MSNELDDLGYLVAAAQDNPSVGEDVVWLQDTAARCRARYAQTLRILADLPTLLGDLGRVQIPENAAGAALALEDVLSLAMTELEGMGEYLRAIVDPGPAYCAICGLPIGVFHGHDGWQHYEIGPQDVPFMERRQTLVEAQHEADPRWDRPERPDWAAIEGDTTGGGL